MDGCPLGGRSALPVRPLCVHILRRRTLLFFAPCKRTGVAYRVP